MINEEAKTYLDKYRQRLRELSLSGEAGRVAIGDYSDAVDGLLGTIFGAKSAELLGTVESGLCLLAVGGYGRRELSLHTDVDMVLLSAEASDSAPIVAEAFSHFCWEQGIDLALKTISVDEFIVLAKDDITAATTLADMRFVAGEREILRQFQLRARSEVIGPRRRKLLQFLRDGLDVRHRRFGSTVFLQEPDLKLGHGGLRDGDVLRWSLFLEYAAKEKDWRSRAILTPHEITAYDEAREYFWRLRNALHARSKNRLDRLTFVEQEELAAKFGYEDGLELGVERLMKEYYRYARQVAHLTLQTLAKLAEKGARGPHKWRSLSGNVGTFSGRVTLLRTSALLTEPALSLELYERANQHRRPLYPIAVEALRRSTAESDWRQRLRASLEVYPRFLKLLTAYEKWPGRDESLVEAMHDVGMVAAMLPEFEVLVGRITHDVFHVYTSDVFAVRTVATIHRWRRGDFREDLQLVQRLITETFGYVPTVVAALCSPIAHRYRHRVDSEVVLDICRRLELSSANTREVLWLVENQKRFFDLLTKRDWTDAATVDELRSLLQSRDRLRDIWVLSLAVNEAVRPEGVSAWLASVYRDGFAFFSRVLEQSTTATGYRALWEESRIEELRADDRNIAAFLARFPARYLRGNGANSISFHFDAWNRFRADSQMQVQVANVQDGATEVVIACADAPGLLAKVARAFARAGLDVREAQIYTIDGVVLDIFRFPIPQWATADKAGLALVETRLQNEIEQADEERPWPKIPSWRRRTLAQLKPLIRIDNSSSEVATIVDVTSADAPGMLAVITESLFRLQLSIRRARLNSEGGRIIDVFYVTDGDGQKIAPENARSVAIFLEDAMLRHQQSVRADV